uniref:glycerol kinase n=1 Tax=Tetradesmus obliquus TaxID=3088 RepID=A0A383V639_TETOB|eukprot:jgi/Sobl393_1/1333/SZX59806.1
MAPLYLGLDVGTQGVKAVVYDSKLKQIVGRGAQPWAILESTVPGRAEQHPTTWVEGTIAAAKQALSAVDRSAVKAVAVSGQQHGMVALAADGSVLRPAKLWCDTESAPEAAELSQKLGYTVVPSFTSTKLLWLQRHEPEVWSRLAAVLLPHDYMNYWLTGKQVTEAGDASGTGLLDVAQRCWDARLVAMIDDKLAGCLQRIIGPDESVGTVLPEVADLLGLGHDVVVAPGSGDNAMSALGSGITQPGELVVSLGTSATLFGVSGQPIIDPSCAVCPFCDATGAWLPLICTLNCTVPAEEVITAFGISHEQATALAEKEPAGSGGVSFLPYLVGERTPNWPDSSGAVVGLRPGLLKPGVLYRAALEGATLSLAAALSRATDLGLVPKELRLVGGGSKNALWRQIVADVFQLPVKLPLEAESAALGAALQAAAVHSGVPVGAYVQQNQPPISEQVVQPNPANKQAYEEALQRHMQRGQRLFAPQQQQQQ